MKMNKRNFSLWILFAVILFVFSGCSTRKQPGVSGEKIREYANELYNRELYSQAVHEYEKYLDLYSVDEEQQANIHFVIGNIYFDRLHDYENALAVYLKIKHVFPESAVRQQADKRIVACLERLQRSTDAKQALDEAAVLEPDKLQSSHPGTVIAKIGDQKITSGDLKYHIDQLPDYIRSQLDGKEAKLDFLKQYVATELFYDAAKRKELEKDKEVIEGTFQAKKSLMVQKYLQDEIAGQIQINQEDAELYFKANKEKYVEKDDKGKVKRHKFFQEVQKEVAEDLVREKQQKAYEELLGRMMRAEKVEIYDDLVK
jgi:tetratricopeptide (TPR) repeat protein